MKKVVWLSVLLAQGMEAAERAKPEDRTDVLEDDSEQTSLRDEKSLLRQLAQVRSKKAPLEGVSEAEELRRGEDYSRMLADGLDGLRKKEMALLVFLIDVTKKQRGEPLDGEESAESVGSASQWEGNFLNRVVVYENELAELAKYLDQRTRTIFEQLIQARDAKEGAIRSKHTLEQMGTGWGALGQDPELLIGIYQEDENKALQAVARLLKR